MSAAKALQLARDLQKRGFDPFTARCNAAHAYGISVGDINRQYALWRKTVKFKPGKKPEQMMFNFKEGN